MGEGGVIVLGIETSTPQTSVALGSEQGVMASTQLASEARQDRVAPILEHLLEWTGVELSHVGGVAVGVGPGLFTGLRVGVATGKTLAQVLSVPIVGITSLDVLAFGVRYTRRLIGAVIDARRGEVFHALYRGVPGGVMRLGEYGVAPPGHLAAELEAAREEVLLVGNGAILYRKELEAVGAGVEFASPPQAYPQASAMVELAVPRFIREETDRSFEVLPLYLRKSDAEIAWDQRARGATA
ncbi:MAG TPA: tRNA (adenosine(37)-N6)-threonylcarbamoyltransferase complex dimerization subunit type 1 TsaB [Actinomycetota bacterium]|nr:tRNA (adenosine(37)-N6)-threonylcarbamoyltransferase complex dimerization subunit type 1 TsaB [Actinomycetota bacterium]